MQSCSLQTMPREKVWLVSAEGCESRFPGRRRKTGQRGKLHDCLPRDPALESLILGAGRLLPSVCLPGRKQLLWGSINSLRGKQTGPEVATSSLRKHRCLPGGSHCTGRRTHSRSMHGRGMHTGGSHKDK